MIAHAGGPFVFVRTSGFTCSVCAPKEMTAAQIESFAHSELGPTSYGSDWRAFDKSKLFPATLATPNPCEATSDRLHWFLIAAELAAKFSRSVH
jgi:hypothetical protein